jgi:hypothetical protein
MTTLAGLHRSGLGTWIGADSRATSDNLKIGPISKWVRVGGWAIGCAGDLKTINIIRSESAMLFEPTNDPQVIVQRLERMMIKHNYTAATDGPFGPPAWGQSFLLASPDGLWDLDGHLSVFPVPADTVWAAGSGRDFALGAGLASAQLSECAPADRVRLAIEAAMAYDVMSGHGGWFDHLTAPASGCSTGRTIRAAARKSRLRDK